MERNENPRENTDLQNLFLEMVKDKSRRDLLDLIMRYDDDQAIYDLLIQRIKQGKHDKT